MADLNKELNEYLLSNKNEKQFKIVIPPVALPKTNIGKWFGRNTEETREQTGWAQRMQNECCPTLTRIQRFIAFGICFLMGILCFCLSTIYIPVLLLKARKFALLYTLGSIFFLASFCFLWGPLNYLKSLFTSERRYLTLLYFATLIGTLYFALHVQSTPLTVLCAVLQLIAMMSFLVIYMSGSLSSLMFFTKIFRTGNSLPV